MNIVDRMLQIENTVDTVEKHYYATKEDNKMEKNLYKLISERLVNKSKGQALTELKEIEKLRGAESIEYVVAKEYIEENFKTNRTKKGGRPRVNRLPKRKKGTPSLTYKDVEFLAELKLEEKIRLHDLERIECQLWNDKAIIVNSELDDYEKMRQAYKINKELAHIDKLYNYIKKKGGK